MEKELLSSNEISFEREIKPELIKEIEKLDILMEQDRVNFLLVLAGLKPASDITIFGNWDIQNKDWHPNEEEIKKGKEEILKLWSVVEESGLVISYDKKKFLDIAKNFEYMQVGISIGRGQKELDIITEATIKNNDEAKGIAYGFPPTAVEAYLGKRKKLYRQNLPEEVRLSDSIAFCFFILSEDNWQEEIKQGQIYADYIKKISPYLYQKILEHEAKQPKFKL